MQVCRYSVAHRIAISITSALSRLCQLGCRRSQCGPKRPSAPTKGAATRRSFEQKWFRGCGHRMERRCYALSRGFGGRREPGERNAPGIEDERTAFTIATGVAEIVGEDRADHAPPRARRTRPRSSRASRSSMMETTSNARTIAASRGMPHRARVPLVQESRSRRAETFIACRPLSISCSPDEFPQAQHRRLLRGGRLRLSAEA